MTFARHVSKKLAEVSESLLMISGVASIFVFLLSAEEKTVNAAAAWIEKLKIKNGVYNPDDNPNPGEHILST